MHLENKRFPVKAGHAIKIQTNTFHSINNTTKKPLKLFVVCSPPYNPKDVVER